MSAGEYLGGVALFVAMLAPVLGGTVLLMARRLAHLEGAERVVAFGVIATAGVLAVHVVPLALDALSPGTVVIAALLWLAAGALVPAARHDPGPEAEDEAEDRPADGVALLAVGLMALFTLAFARDQVLIASGSIDFTNFHLPTVVGWIQDGSLWQVSQFIPSVAPGNYPNNGDVMLLAVALPWDSDFATHVVMYPFYALVGVGVYALARSIGARRAPAAIAGCLVMAIPALTIATLVAAITDAVMLFAFVAGVLFLVRHRRSGYTSDLVIAGLALGISFGTKWYAVSSVAIVVVVWAVASFLARRQPRVVLRQGAVLVGLVALAGGIWLLRNWIISGNPVFPVKVAPLGITLFDAPPDIVRELAGFTILDYVTNFETAPWSDWILPQWRQSLSATTGLVLLGALLAVGALVRDRRQPNGRAVPLVFAVGALLLAAAYAITPYTAGGPEGFPVLTGADSRYALPAIAIAAALAAWGIGKFRWGPVAFGVIGLLAIAHGLSWSARGELSPATLEPGDWVAGAIAIVVIGAAAWAGVTARHRLAPRAFRVGIAGAAVLASVAAVAAGRAWEERFDDDRYIGADAVLDQVLVAEGSHRVGLAGSWSDEGISPVLPAFGPRFENEVSYLGPVEREMLMRYTDRTAFVEALERADLDLLLVGRGRPSTPPVREDEWAESAGFERIAESERLLLYSAPA